MKIINNENISPFDVDETLVCHDPLTCSNKVYISDRVSGKLMLFGINEPMVRLLREEKDRGSYVIVWSRAGHAWASAVVKALELEDCVDLILTKPRVYFDDKPVDFWMKDRVYLEPGTKYKTANK